MQSVEYWCAMLPYERQSAVKQQCPTTSIETFARRISLFQNASIISRHSQFMRSTGVKLMAGLILPEISLIQRYTQINFHFFFSFLLGLTKL
jgi:hypothetical protein